MKKYCDANSNMITLSSFRQNKDTKKGKKLKGKYLCNMCGGTFERKNMILFAEYELSPCCRSINYNKMEKL